MNDDQALELEALEGILNDTTAEPIKLSYGLLKLITDNFRKEIGHGGFGVVYQGDLQNGAVAVKKITNVHNVTDKQFMDEIKCLRSANHKNIVRFLGYCADTQEEIIPFNGTFVMAGQPNRLLCFEYVPNGNIRQYLEQEKSHADDWPTRYRLIRGICQGLQFLHDKRINHLDLKPENVMLDAHMEAKITDFGLSRFLDQGQSKMTTKHICGTLRYIAPEVIDNRELSFKSDIYALGIIIIELLTGISMISLNNWDESLHLLDCPRVEMCAEMARKCIYAKRDNRPTIHEVIRDLDDQERRIPDSSTNQARNGAFSGTELLDAYPLELRFPFQSNQSNTRSVALSNKMNNSVGFIVAPYSDTMDVVGSSSGTLNPLTSRIVELTLQHQEERVPLDQNKALVIMVIMKPGHDVHEIISKAQGVSCRDKSWSTSLLEKATELGEEMHWATLTAVVCEPGPTKMTPAFVGKEYDPGFAAIKSIEVHAKGPWVLVHLSSGIVYVWNWRTRKIIYAKHGQASSAIFISRNEWIVVGDVYGSISVYTCPYMDLVKNFSRNAGRITSLAVHPTRPFLLSHGQLDNVVRLWDWDKDWSCIQTFEDASRLKQLMFNPNDTNTFSALGLDEKVKMWALDDSDHISTLGFLEGAIMMDYLSPNSDNGRYSVNTTHYPDTHIFDLKNGTRVHTISVLGLDMYIRGTLSVTAIACHPTRPLLVIAMNTGKILVWDSTTYRLMKEYPNMRRNPIDIALIGTRRLVIAYEQEITIMEIDL